MSTASSPVQEQKQRVENLLQKLNGLIKKLPTMVPCGSKDGPITKHFSDYTHDTSEGPFFTFNQSRERVFQCVNSEKQYLMVQEKYGLDLVHAYITHFSRISGIEANNGLDMMAQHVDELITLIEMM